MSSSLSTFPTGVIIPRGAPLDKGTDARNLPRQGRRRSYICRLFLRHNGVRFVHGVHMLPHTHHHVAVTPLVVIPGNQLHKVIVQHDAGLGIKDGGLKDMKLEPMNFDIQDPLTDMERWNEAVGLARENFQELTYN